MTKTKIRIHNFIFFPSSKSVVIPVLSTGIWFYGSAIFKHYQLLQSDLSAPKYTICLFLSYIFLCSHTWISAILVVSRVYYSCTSYSVISKGGIPFPSPDFQNLTAPTFIMALSLMFMHFCTGVCVCVFPQSFRGKTYLWGNSPKHGSLF